MNRLPQSASWRKPAGRRPGLLAVFGAFSRSLSLSLSLSLLLASSACGLRPRSSHIRSTGDVTPAENVLDYEGRVLWVGQDGQQGLCVRYSEIENNCVIVRLAKETEDKKGFGEVGTPAPQAAGKGTCAFTNAQDSINIELVCKTESGAACLQGLSPTVVSFASRQVLLQTAGGGVALARDQKTRVRLDDQKCRNELGLIEKKGNDLRVAQAASVLSSSASMTNGAQAGAHKTAGAQGASGQTVPGDELQNLVNLFSARHIIATYANETHCLFFAGQNKPCWGYTRTRPAAGETAPPIVGPFNYTSCGFSRSAEETEQNTLVAFSAASETVSPVSITIAIAKNRVGSSGVDQPRSAELTPPFQGREGERLEWAPKPCSGLPESFPAPDRPTPVSTPQDTKG